MNKRLFSILLIMLMTVSILAITAVETAAEHPFTDVPDWASAYVDEVYEKGIMNGTGGTKFGSDQPLTREQLVVTLYRISGSTVTGTLDSLKATFSDAADISDWAYNAVEWASREGITSGVNQGDKLYFKPKNDVTRQEAAKFFITFIDYMKLDAPTDNVANIRDMDKVGSWALPYVERCIAAGIINGDGNGNFDPTGKTVRIAAAKMLACLPDTHNHEYEAVVTAPTCTEEGYTTYTCAECGDSYVADEVAALGHDEVIDTAVVATCTTPGLTSGRHCSVCGEILVAQQTVAATGKHKYEYAPGDIASAQVVITHTCSVCGDTYTETVTTSDFTVTSSNRDKIGFTLESDKNLVIPAVFNDNGTWYKVVGIGSHAFYERTNLTNVTIPDSVIIIGYRAFYGCTNLESIIIPDSVTAIDSEAFFDCNSLTSITIPDSVTSIGEWAFFRCISLANLKIDNGVTNIGEYAFSDCIGLTNITIPDSVTTISVGTFSSCSSLTSVTIPDSVTVIDDMAFYMCDVLTNITFTGTVEQWNNITFGSDWKFGAPATVVVCSDGIISLSDN